ncbi:nucleoid occlusion protein [Lacticaseibacillus kribbianus]|uniref:nucleoid occlusion protein n=1 Tax=Lacticaseibacillus kribbianus TaxID=2926292 RepID=UPI001CD2B125|nr:nucleoid occlusion protein [Lacticaseibacillus kribbianus]
MIVALFFNKKKPAAPAATVVQDIPLSAIVPNRFQPRKVFSADAIAELAATIKDHGLLQPIVVREYAPGHYEIIAGERRFRAMQSLAFEKAPAIVQKMTDAESASMALVENLQREGLSPIEEAQAYVELMKLNDLTQQGLAAQMGKSQSFVANKLRLLKLSEPVQTAILNGELSERHGRELLRCDDYQQQLLLHDILANGLTVAETHAAVEALLNPEPLVTPEPEVMPEPATEPDDKAEKPAPKKRKMIKSKDTRMAVNTLKKSVAMIKQSGVKAKVTEEETADGYRFIVELPKEKR